MKITDSLYTYGIKERKLDKVLAKIRHSKKIRNLYVVVLPLVNDGILEIYDYNQLLQPFYLAMSDDIYIVGLAKDKDDAMALVVDIIQDMHDLREGDDILFDTNKFFGFVS